MNCKLSNPWSESDPAFLAAGYPSRLSDECWIAFARAGIAGAASWCFAEARLGEAPPGGYTSSLPRIGYGTSSLSSSLSFLDCS